MDILARDDNVLARWFHNKGLKLNNKKPLLILFGIHTRAIPIKIDKTVNELSRKEKLLGIISYDKLSFKSHIHYHSLQKG